MLRSPLRSEASVPPPSSTPSHPGWRRRQLAPLLAALSLVVACSSEDDEPNPAVGGSAGVSGGGAAGTPSGGSGGDGTGGTAQAGAGGSAGAAGDGAGGAVCPEGSLFCDDFEQAPLGPIGAPWRPSLNMASVDVDEQQAFSGAHAVHVNAPQEGTYHRGYFALDQGSSAGIFPAVAQEMYGRAMVYIGALPNADVHWTFIQAEGPAADGTHNALYRYGGQHENGAQLMANYETNNISTDCWDHSTTQIPTGQWQCVEWRFNVPTNEMQFWLEGEELTDIHVTGMGEGCVGQALNGQWLAPPAFQSLYLGWEHYQQASNPIDMWVDAVVVDTQRVGCPAVP